MLHNVLVLKLTDTGVLLSEHLTECFFISCEKIMSENLPSADSTFDLHFHHTAICPNPQHSTSRFGVPKDEWLQLLVVP